jgi:hypothetical protein
MGQAPRTGGSCGRLRPLRRATPHELWAAYGQPGRANAAFTREQSRGSQPVGVSLLDGRLARPGPGAVDSGSSVQPVCVRHCEVAGDGLVEVGDVLDQRAAAEANVLADGRLALAEQG